MAAKKRITEIVAEELGGFLDDNGYELYNVEYVKEGKDYFLRVYIDMVQAAGEEERYVGTDDCEKVSRHLGERLDELDPIDRNYYLEVSSPGLERTLYKEKDYQRQTGKEVEVRLYSAMNGRKTFSGTLNGLVDGCVVITDGSGAEARLPIEQVAKTKLKKG